MGWLRKIWDGPFKTPQLAQPIAVGWVLLKLFETVWRLFLILCLLAALAIFGFWISERNPISSQIGIGLSPSPTGCVAKGWPILAHIENKSSKTIGEVDLKFRVYQRGTSVDVVSYNYTQPELHQILGPGKALEWCFAMPQLNVDSTGPYAIAADVTYASELSNGIPVTAAPPPPAIETTVAR